MTIETKKAANVKEALEILNSLLPNGSFEYHTENYSDDYKTTNRFFRATAENGATCYGMIEFVENGTLVKVRFVDIYEETAVDIEIENFTSGVANVENNAKTTVETKVARNGSLIVKVNGKRAKFYETASLIGNLRNPNLEIRTDRNVTYAQTCIEKCHAVYFKDSTGNLYKFDYFFSETTLRNIATGNLHNNLYKTAAEREEILSTPLVTIEAQDAAIDAEIELANKNAKKLYSINPVAGTESVVKFNHLDILITPDGGLRIDGWFNAKHIETAYRRFVKIMTQAANDIPQLKGWDCWLPANKITADNGSFFNENGDLLFTDNDPRDTLAVDINEDTFYFFANFSPCVKPLDGFNYGMATDYQPQTNWENPHDFTITGDLSDRNINGRIAAFNHKEEVTLTDNMKLAKQITDKLGSLLVKFSHANEGNDGGLALHYETFKDEHDEFGTLTRVVEVFTDQTNFILDHVNFITGYGDDKKVEKFFFKRDDFSDFEQHLLALQKEQEDAYPEEVKALNRDLAQSNLTAPNVHLHIYNNDFHIGSFCGVELSKLHVKSFVTDKIHFNVCYASEPLEHYDTFEEVTAAINLFKDAIKRGATQFKFPTSDELNLPTDKQINDSLVRAMETNLKNIQAHLLNNDINAAIAELNLYHICDNALLRKEVA